MGKTLRTSLGLFVLLFLVTGLAYPMAVLALGQMLFPNQANGSLIEERGTVIGSALIAQNFAGAGYFHPRASYAGNGYDATNSSGSDLAPSSADLLKAVGDRVTALKAENAMMPVPADLATGSGSGLDPDISEAAARFQTPRVAKARGIEPGKVAQLIDRHVTERTFGLLGENRVNVLELNRALDALVPMKP